MKNFIKFTFVFLLGTVSGAILFKFGYQDQIMSNKFALKTKEPLLISGEDGQKVFSLLPSGTTLYQEKSWPEGHTTYKAYFNFKGKFEAEKVDPATIDPLWLYNLSKEDVIKFMQDYPLTLGEFRKVLKAQKITREEYIQILRDWEGNPPAKPVQ